MKQITLLFCALIFMFTAGAQNVVRGLVKDIQNQPVAGATLQLLRAADSMVVQALSANGNGEFEFTANGELLIRVTAVGYQPYCARVDSSRHLVIRLLAQKPGTMNAVTVTARKPLVEHDLDKTIINVEAMIAAATSNVLDVLGKTPGVTVDNDGAISLYGRSGVMVLIDGRQTYMSGPDLANYLRSLPGSMLDKLELMTNPPAKFDANGSSIINVRLKKNRRRGYFGSLALGYNQGRRGRSNNSLNVNYNRGKINVFANIGFNKDANRIDDRYDRTLPQSAVHIHTITNNSNYSFPLRAGMDYSLTPSTIVGVVAQYSKRRSHDDWQYTSDSGIGNTVSRGDWEQRSMNVNAQHNFKKSGHEISADLNYIQYDNDSRQDLSKGIVYLMPSFMKIYNAKSDYSLPLKHRVSFSAGVKWSLVQNDSRNDANHFLYDERIYAAYINTRKDWNRVALQLGLRTENTYVKGNQLSNAVTFSNSYTGVFPTFFASYKLDTLGKHNISVSYSRRLNRPSYNQLNPFLIYKDQYTYTTGNPYLGPTYQNNVQLNYRYKQWLNVMAQYGTLHNLVIDVTRAEGNNFVIRPENLSGGRMFALVTNLNLSPAKWLRANLNTGVANFKNKLLIDGQFIELTRYVFRFEGNAQFTLPKDWSAELSGQYMSPMINWQRTIAARYRMNAALQKKVLKGKGSLKLSVDDMFYWWKDRMEFIGIKDVTAVQVVRQDMRRVGLAFNYNFGKESFARKRKHSDNAADDVKGRVE